MIAEKPFDAGALQVSETCVFAGVATTEVGAPGVVYGVAAFETVDALPVPAAFTALTRKVYEVPGVNPVTVALVKVEVPSAKVLQVDPLLEYSTT